MLYDSVVDYEQKDMDYSQNVQSIGMTKKSRNKNHSNNFNIKFILCHD